MLDETALRTPGFTEGYRVQLADGQEWTFPKPRLKFFPARGQDGKIELGGGATFDDEEYRSLMSEYFEVDREDLYAAWSCKVRVACHLLLRNYSLADEALTELLPVEFDDEANMEMWRDLTPLLRGMPPKHLTDGLNAPFSPTESQTV